MLPKTLQLLFFYSVLFVSNSVQYVGEECTVDGTEEKSTCVLYENCNTLTFPPQICDFVDGNPVVCCPGNAKSGRIALEACRKLEDDLVSTSNRTKRETTEDSQPERAVLKEFRHLALLGYEGDENEWLCEGVLISEQFVLTAAQCARLVGPKTLKYVRLGDLDFDNDDDGAQYQEVNVSEIVKHPDYNASSYYNGIALLKLETPVTFNDFVGPACLQTEKELNRTDKNLVLASWGRFGFACERSSQLLKSSVPLSSQESCNNSYKNANRRRLKNGIDEAQHICAYDPESFCGIAGSPLQMDKRVGNVMLSTVVGIATFGPPCGLAAGIPTVYTRISNYIEWIEDTVWKDHV